MDFIQESFKWQSKFDEIQGEKNTLKEENARLKAALKGKESSSKPPKSKSPSTTEKDRIWKDAAIKNMARYTSKYG
jgi:hypothetical protein